MVNKCALILHDLIPMDTESVPILTGEGIENYLTSFNTTLLILLTALVILLGYKIVPLPLLGPGDALKGPTVRRPLLVKPSSGE